MNGVFLRVDRDDPDAWKQDLANVRYLTDENMSGSTQFSVNQFRALVPELRKSLDHRLPYGKPWIYKRNRCFLV